MEDNFPGVYCTGHIVFLIVGFVLLAAAAVFIRKLRDEKKVTVFVKALAALLLVWIVINRVSVTAVQVSTEPETYSWLNLLPYTFCGLASLVYSLTVLFGKKNCTVMHFIFYFGFFGGLCTLFYPNFLDTQTFWDIRSFSGLVHHYLMVCLSVLTFVSGYFQPRLKKWYVFPLGFSLMMLLGLFELDALGFAEAMNIGKPLVGSLPVLTSWYVLFAVGTAVVFVFSLAYERWGKRTAGKQN